MALVPFSVVFMIGLGLLYSSCDANLFPDLPEPPQSYFQKIPSFSFNKNYHNDNYRPYSGYAPKLPITDPQPQIPNPIFSKAPHHMCPKGFVPAGERCLWINQSPLPWRSAQNFCNQYGLRLLELRSGNYYVDVVTALNTQNDGQGTFWVGASKRMGSWGWNSKYINIPESFWAVTFINGKPAKEPIDDRKHCAFLDGDRWYFLNADHCDSYKQFICEKIPAEQPSFNNGVYFESEDGGEAIVGEASEGPSCEEGWDGYGESCYSVSEKEEPYLEAKQACEQLNSTMVSLHDAEENEWVSDLVSSVVNNVTLIWIGLVRGTNVDFEWDDGSTYEYSNWHDQEPNNIHHSEHCVHLEVNDDNKWRDEFCGGYHRFVCKKAATTE